MDPNRTSKLCPFSSFIVLFVLLVPSVVLGRARMVKDAHEDEKKLLEPVMTAVEKALAFFSEDVASLNLDGLFGMRVAQGQLEEAVKECRSAGGCPRQLVDRLQALVDRTAMAADAALSYVQKDDAEYFSWFRQVVDRAFRVPYRPHPLTHLAMTPPGSDASYDEEKGDRCMARIMGTYKEERSGRKVEECNVTDSCWDMMTQEGTCKYAITHQLIYFSFIEKQGCTDRVEQAMEAKVSEAQERMCGSIYNEAMTEVKDGKTEEILQDLFLEQVLVCGSLGFENFMRSDWIRMVLTWQKPTGCFSMDNPSLLDMETQLVKAQEEERELLRDLKLEASMIEQQHRSGRKLLREHVMGDGCLSHKSGLGFGVLGLYARYLIQENFIVQ